MKLITLTNITLNSTPTSPVTFYMSWRRTKDDDIPSSYNALPNVSVDTDGTILSPNPYKFSVPDTSITVKAVSACGDFYQKTFIVCEPVTNLAASILPVCDTGYTLSPDKTYCYKLDQIPASLPSGSGDITVATSGNPYSTCGSYIYGNSYTISGSGPHTLLTPSGTFWLNGGTCADNNTTDGPMNRCALWASNVQDDQDIGFSVCLTLATTKTYYVGIGCDNYGTIKLDGKIILKQDENVLDTMYSIGGSAFKVWHIYPVTIPAGPHVLELIGHNVTNIAGMGAEIYDNTQAELAAATSYADLNLIFSTKDYRGQPVQYGTNGAGYSCPDGYYLSACNAPYVCKKTTTKSPSTGKLSLSFSPEEDYTSQYKIQVFDANNLSVDTNHETLSAPFPATVSKQYNTPSYGNYVVKITATACNSNVGQKSVNANAFCSPARNLTLSGAPGTTSANFIWTAPQYVNSTNYTWEVYNSSNVVVKSGSVLGNALSVTGLSSGQNYILRLYTKCQEGVYSTSINYSFTTS